MKKTILLLFALFAFTAMAQSVITGHDSIVSLVNDHTDSVVTAAQDTLITTAQKTTESVGFGWKLIAGILVVAEVVLRIIPSKNAATLLGLVSWLHSVIPNNIKKKSNSE